MKKKLKNTFIFTLSLGLALTFATGSTNAKNITNEEKKIIFEQSEITDLDKLYEMAKEESGSKKSQSLSTENSPESNKFSIVGDKGTVELETLSATQLLKVTDDGNVKEEFYTTTFFAQPTNEEIALASSSKNNSDTDGSSTVRANSTIYYTNTTLSGFAAIKLDSVSAGWTVLDSQFTLSNRRVQFSANGNPTGGTSYIQQVSPMYTTSSNSVSYTSGFKPVRNDGMMLVGVTTYVNVNRSSQSFEFVLSNNL